MTILDRALNLLGYTKSHVANPPAWISNYSEAHEFWQPAYGEASGQTDLYTKVSWISSAVNLVASIAATTPLSVKQRTDDGHEDIDSHPFEERLRKPNQSGQSRHEFLYSTMAWYLVTGNCYWWLNRSNENSEPDEIYIIPSGSIRPVPDKRTFIRGYLYDAGDGIEMPIEPHEICHFKNWNPNNLYVGLSPLSSLYNTAIQDYESTRWNKNFFAKDNAKPTGMLAFADPIDEHTWQQMKSDISREYGGNQRKMMLLRGAGQGKVNYIPMMITQSEMQFLESRKFNRDEIFNAIAPGSAAMVDVNATEANSKTGRDVFFSIGVYPRLDFIAQKITSDLLSTYGDNLICEFEDVRQRDIQLELQQITTFAQTHTINEVRREWYSDDELDDERGEMLVAQIGQSQIVEDEPEEEQPTEIEQIPAQIEQANDNDTGNEIEEQLKALLSEIRSLKSATSYTPTTVTINQSSPEAPYKIAEPEQITGPTQAEIDLDLWQKKAKNRVTKGRNQAVPFESESIPNAVKAFVSFGLDRGDDIGDVFTQAKTILQYDPDDDEAEYQFRFNIEVESIDRLAKALGDDFERFQEMLGSGDIDTAEMNRIINQLTDDSLLQDALQRTLVVATDLGVSVAVKQLENVGIGFDWTLANVDAREWARENSAQLVSGIHETTRRSLRTAIAAWIDNGEALDELIIELTPVFGVERAELIAATEVTKAYAEGSRLGYYHSSVVEQMEWRTANDERVCPICAPLGGINYGSSGPVRAGIDGGFVHPGGLGAADKHTGKSYRLPPAHPRCRCWIAPVIEVG